MFHGNIIMCDIVRWFMMVLAIPKKDKQFKILLVAPQCSFLFWALLGLLVFPHVTMPGTSGT